MSHSYRGTARNVDARNVGACTEPFRSAHIEDPKSTRLGFGVFSEGSSRSSPVEEAMDLATVV